jgi:hypothetical protein
MKPPSMIKMGSLLKASFNVLLCAGLFSVQTALPLLHEWHVAVEEAAAHRLDIVPDGLTPLLSQGHAHPGHEHHNPATCSVDRFLSQGRYGVAPDRVFHPIFLPKAEVLSVGRSFIVLRGPDFSGSSPRAPPL